MTRYGVTTDYEYNATRKLQSLTIWSGTFYDTWEAQGYARPGAGRLTLSTYNEDKVVVTLPDGVTFPRTAENYEAIDEAIGAALNAYEQERGSVQMMPDLPPGDDGTPLNDDVPAPGADDRDDDRIED